MGLYSSIQLTRFFSNTWDGEASPVESIIELSGFNQFADEDVPPQVEVRSTIASWHKQYWLHCFFLRIKSADASLDSAEWKIDESHMETFIEAAESVLTDTTTFEKEFPVNNITECSYGCYERETLLKARDLFKHLIASKFLEKGDIVYYYC